MKFLIVEPSPLPILIPLGPRILFSNTLSLHPSLNVRDHASQPHSTAGSVKVTTILAETLLWVWFKTETSLKTFAYWRWQYMVCTWLVAVLRVHTCANTTCVLYKYRVARANCLCELVRRSEHPAMRKKHTLLFTVEPGGSIPNILSWTNTTCPIHTHFFKIYFNSVL